MADLVLLLLHAWGCSERGQSRGRGMVRAQLWGSRLPSAKQMLVADGHGTILEHDCKARAKEKTLKRDLKFTLASV